ncbi:MAG: PDDEXK nuclease domain-containing protein [Fibromonadaceae bacterium]|jgi:predicted nuclease of restriction endonuclease-like (RecB) superfamily|nr:PDDEXK nuclease domain-containing protein [Fibromonadaceae bacterium]
MKKNVSIKAKIKKVGEYNFLNELKQIILSARKQAYSAVNLSQVCANWLIGQRIVEQEQAGQNRADYGKYLIKLVAQELTNEFGNGYSETNIKSFRKFYIEFQDITIGQAVPAQSGNKLQETEWSIKQALPAILSWTHYERLMRVTNHKARSWYMKEAATQMWSYRTLDRNISTQYYERLLLSQVKGGVEKEMKQKTAAFQSDKLEFIKNPTVLEFLGLKNNKGYSENDLETAILNNLQNFLMELGKGFAFVERQQLIRTETEDYHIDLTFYNYILKCFVLFDLKIGKITHQDVGQMDMYVRMFDELKRNKGDNPTIGIVLCSETDSNIARYSILKGSERLFATKYQLYLPSVKELQEEIERETAIIKMQLKKRY